MINNVKPIGYHYDYMKDQPKKKPDLNRKENLLSVAVATAITTHETTSLIHQVEKTEKDIYEFKVGLSTIKMADHLSKHETRKMDCKTKLDEKAAEK